MTPPIERSFSLREFSSSVLISSTKNTSISTSGAAGVFFAARKNIYLFPRLDDAYYVILDQPGPISDKSDYMEHLRKMAKIIQGNEDYKIIYKGSYYLVAKKK